MFVRVVSFAQLREIVGADTCVEMPAQSTVMDLREAIVRDYPGFAAALESTRLARNGRILSDLNVALESDDEVALLPPVGGG